MKKWYLGFMITLAFFFTLIVGFIAFDSDIVKSFDEAIFSFIGSLRNDPLSFIMLVITFLGEEYFLITFVILLLILPNRKTLGFPVAIVASISASLNIIVKHLVARSRPIGEFIGLGYPFPTTYSFPSGHSQTAIVVYWIFIYLLVKKYGKNLLISKIVLVSSFTLLLGIGFSRAYIGVHYPSDVLAGWLLGFTVIVGFMYYQADDVKNT